ncbi:unnamed protein product [Effrenium voratum]|nr:unnamed protein product [Effrenium voratum]
MLWLCWLALFLPLLADLAEDCHECGSVELLQKRARRQHVEQDDVAAQCSACCHGLKDYEVCGWCPESRSCVTITDDKSTCLVVTSENQCWGASFPASMSNYAGKIAQTFKARNKEAAVLKPLVTPYPTYAALDPPQTGIFDFASGVSLSSLQGNPAENVVIGAAADWGSGTGESMVVATLLSQEQPHLTIHLGDVYLVGDAEDYRHNVMGIDPPASRGQKGVQWPKGSHTTFLMPGNHEQIDGMNGLVEQGYSYSGQKANFGAWFSDHWRFIALDTGALCMPLGPAPNFARKLGIETSAPLTPEQVQ